MSDLSSPGAPSSPLAAAITQATQMPSQTTVEGDLAAPYRQAQAISPQDMAAGHGLATLIGPNQHAPVVSPAASHDSVAASLGNFEGKKADVRTAALAAYLSNLGQTLTQNVDIHQQATNVLGPQRAAVSASASEASRFHILVQHGKILPGKDQPDLASIWNRMVSTPELSTDAERRALSDFQVDLARRLQYTHAPGGQLLKPLDLIGVEPTPAGPVVHAAFDGSNPAQLGRLMSRVDPQAEVQSVGPHPGLPTDRPIISLRPQGDVTVHATADETNRQNFRTLYPIVDGQEGPVRWMPTSPRQVADVNYTGPTPVPTQLRSDPPGAHPSALPSNHMVIGMDSTNPLEVDSLKALLRDNGIDVSQAKTLHGHLATDGANDTHKLSLWVPLGDQPDPASVKAAWNVVNDASGRRGAPTYDPAIYMHGKPPVDAVQAFDHVHTDGQGTAVTRHADAMSSPSAHPVWVAKAPPPSEMSGAVVDVQRQSDGSLLYNNQLKVQVPQGNQTTPGTGSVLQTKVDGKTFPKFVMSMPQDDVPTLALGDAQAPPGPQVSGTTGRKLSLTPDPGDPQGLLHALQAAHLLRHAGVVIDDPLKVIHSEAATEAQ